MCGHWLVEEVHAILLNDNPTALRKERITQLLLGKREG